MSERRTITVRIWFLLLEFEQCWNCRLYVRPSRLRNMGPGSYCKSCRRDLDREIEPAEMDYAEEQHHAEQIDSRRDASGRAQLRGTTGAAVLYDEHGPPKADAVESWPGARRYRERLGKTLLEYRAKTRARQ